MRSLFIAAILLASSASPLFAGETINYTYDALGRLVQVGRSGSINAGTNAAYTYDKADNRTNVTVTGSGNTPPVFSITGGSATEGGPITFTVTKSGSTTSTYTVNTATANGSALAGSDYNAVSGTLTFAPADVTKAVSISTIDDTAIEPSETFTVGLSGASGGATISTAQATGTINDNEPVCGGVSFTITSNGPVTEGGASAFTISKTGATSSSCAISYSAAGGTATSGADFTAASGTLTFTSAQTSQTISVSTIDDSAVESAETFSLALSSPSDGGGLGSPSTAAATINDNDVSATVINLTTGAGVNLRTVANSNGYTGATGVTYTFVVPNAVTVTGSSPGGIAVDTGSWPVGVTLNLQINGGGIVRGGGGRGGNGGGVGSNLIFGPTSGSGGGDAVRCNVNIAITVASGGIVQAGGGGGGGGGVSGYGSGGPLSGYWQVVPGGGGGGGAPNGPSGAGANGFSTVTSTAGSPGTTSGGGGGGTGGHSGGAGGSYGVAGSNGVSGNVFAGGAGGALGYAVRKNSTGCTVTNNGTVTGTVG